MGVHGLWRLIEPSGKPVPIETLENKVLAVDVSIWLHQAVKGFQDSKGSPLPNAHLLGVYHRVCKLLYFRIKPVFVFDGGVPSLKKETIAKRNQQKSKNFTEAGRLQKQLLNVLLKHSAVNKVLSEQAKANIVDNKSSNERDQMYALPLPQLESSISNSDGEETECTTEESSPTRNWDLHTIDVNSVQFKSLPPDVRHEILTELKETRKQSSWGRLHELPTQSNDFSAFQMKRLLTRFSVQTSLEEVEKEMGGHSLSLGELESLLNDQGVITKENIGNRIASDETTRYVLIKDLKQAIEEAKIEQAKLESIAEIELENIVETESENCIIVDKTLEKSNIEDQKTESIANLEYERDLQKALVLSLQDEPSTSTQADKLFSFIESESSESDIEIAKPKQNQTLSSAKSYMMEYSGLTPNEISKILDGNSTVTTKSVIQKNSDSSKAVKEDVSKTNSASDSLLLKNKTNLNVPHHKESTDDSSIKDTINICSKQNESIELESASESDNDFLDVTNEETDCTDKKSLEIVFQPEDCLEDDIFGDIFIKQHLPNDEVEVNRLQNAGITTSNEQSLEITSAEVTCSQNKVDDKKLINGKENNSMNIEENKSSVVDQNQIVVGPEQTVSVLSTKNLQKMEENLRQETKALVAERSAKERLAANITDQMYQETQELLELFGVPYVIAPMEAEAQCAFLDEISLTDGTITDDSDIWLFGGKTVYKNFFNQSKHVMEFRAENIQHNFKLSREQMILLALLVGSDYTVGIQGVGPVTALEILAAFPPNKTTSEGHSQFQILSGLSEFRSWFSNNKINRPRRTLLRNKLKNVSFSDNFPSLQVVKAYLEPEVEKSEEKFSWSRPDLVGLVDFAREKFGWSGTKSEDILKPILNRLDETRVQKSIRDYFQTKNRVDSGNAEKKMSKRVKSAVTRMGKEDAMNSEEDEPQQAEGKGKRKRTKKAVQKANLLSDEDVKVLNQVKTRSRKKVKQIKSDIIATINSEKVSTSVVHKKEFIPQKEMDKRCAIRNKLKAIEVFRKSKNGPGYVKKRANVIRLAKEDAELSESSSE